MEDCNVKTHKRRKQKEMKTINSLKENNWLFQQSIRTTRPEWKSTLPDGKPGLFAASGNGETMLLLVSKDICNFYIRVCHAPTLKIATQHYFNSNKTEADAIRTSNQMRNYFKRLINLLPENFTFRQASDYLFSSKIINP